jgi:(2Fe-2S) ferredoxin/ubiquinone/menaquinone biosynthesis C-methylase UbiE
LEPFAYHVVVCTQQKAENVTCCAASASARIVDTLYSEIGKAGLSDQVIVSNCGCLGLWDSGPVLIVYPEGTWYVKLTPADVQEIVASHLGKGRPVARLQRNDYDAMRPEILEHRQGYFAMLKGKDAAAVFPDDLNEMIRAFMPSRVLLTALELDVFTAIGAGSNADDLAKRIGTDARATEALLNALVSLSVLQKENGAFRNTPTAQRFLAEGSLDSARQGQLHVANMWQRWSHLTESVKTGFPAPPVRKEEYVGSFIAAMDVTARGRARAVVQAVGVNGSRRLLDLGGGSAAYSIAFAKAAPELSSDIVDLPDVALLTQEHINRAGLSNRIHVRPGDMLSVPLAAHSYDLVLLSSICHMFSPEENRTLFARAYEALAPNGRIAVADFIADPAKTSPRSAALFALNMLVATRGGSTYSEPEYEAWLKAAGFRDTRRIRIPGPVNLIVATR